MHPYGLVDKYSSVSVGRSFVAMIDLDHNVSINGKLHGYDVMYVDTMTFFIPNIQAKCIVAGTDDLWLVGL
jgi:hypothetical protein